jgi:hypothetical protein
MGTSTSVGKYMNTPKTTPGQGAQDGVLPGQGLDPLRPDQLADDAHAKDADDQQRKDLLDKAPRLPQPFLDLFRLKVAPRHVAQRRQRPGHGKELAGEAGPPARRLLASMPVAATSNVKTITPNVTQVQRLNFSYTLFRPNQALMPIRANRPIRMSPCTLTPSSPLLASKGTSRSREPAGSQRPRWGGDLGIVVEQHPA